MAPNDAFKPCWLTRLTDDGTLSFGHAIAVSCTIHSDCPNGQAQVLVHEVAGSTLSLSCGTGPDEVWRAGSTVFMLRPTNSPDQASASSDTVSLCHALKCESIGIADALQATLDRYRLQQQRQQQEEAAHGKQEATGTSGRMLLKADGGGGDVNGVKGGSSPRRGDTSVAVATGAGCIFDRKIDKSSSEMYFHYYGMLMHQQNMLQDFTRTGTYYMAILENRVDFEGKVVMDVGAGSGILSLFAAQAGARKVYAVEASGMAKYARQLAQGNPGIGSAIEVVCGKVEEISVPERVDVLVSEPMGTLLVNERMLETYLYARDHFLKPGGKMFPSLGRIHASLFQDHVLYTELQAKAAFWTQTSFYGVDVTPLYPASLEGFFGQVVVDAFEQALLQSDCATRIIDFSTATEGELQDIDLPLQLTVGNAPSTIHGVASWFDVLFNGSMHPTWLSTAPGLPTTHWFQLRCVLQQPLYIAVPGTVVTGRLRLVAHARQSYDVHLTLEAPPLQPGLPPQKASGKYDLKEPYYRQLTTAWQQAAAAAAVTTNADASAPLMAAGAPAGAMVAPGSAPTAFVVEAPAVASAAAASTSPSPLQLQQLQNDIAAAALALLAGQPATLGVPVAGQLAAQAHPSQFGAQQQQPAGLWPQQQQQQVPVPGFPKQLQQQQPIAFGALQRGQALNQNAGPAASPPQQPPPQQQQPAVQWYQQQQHQWQQQHHAVVDGGARTAAGNLSPHPS